MADVKKEEQLSEEEKKRVIIARRFCIGAVTIGLVGAVAYTFGKQRGSYACLEEIYKSFPEVRDVITKIDPAFFTTL